LGIGIYLGQLEIRSIMLIEIHYFIKINSGELLQNFIMKVKNMKHLQINKVLLGVIVIGFFIIISQQGWAQDSENCTLISHWAIGPCYAVDAVGNIAYFGNGSSIEIVDFTDTANPVELGKVIVPDIVEGVIVSNGYAYVANKRQGLRVIDVSNPVSPTEIGFFDTDGYAEDVAVSGDYVYVADGHNGLAVINVSDPGAPYLAGLFDTKDYARGVAISGDYAYVADEDSGLRVIDISDPALLSEVGSIDTEARAYDVALSGDYAYIYFIR